VTPMTSPDRKLRGAANRAARELLIVSDSDKLDGPERDALALVRWFCQEIADGER
jgi:hypothetical protein